MGGEMEGSTVGRRRWMGGEILYLCYCGWEDEWMDWAEGWDGMGWAGCWQEKVK